MGDDGNLWYGGPSNGMIEIMALPVLYSGGSVSSVAVTFCEETETADAMPFMVTIDCGDEFEGETMVTIDDGDGDILKGGGMAYIDNVGPANAPIIIANRNGREMGWINGYVGIAGKYDEDDAEDNWLVEGEDGAGDMGVGGYNMMVRIGEDLEEAVGDDASYSLPGESANNSSYCAVAVATDDLGNMTELPDADDDTCRAAPAGADVLLNHDMAATTPDADGMLTPDVWAYDSNADNDDTAIAPEDVSVADNTVQFGVDMTAPAIEFGDDYDMRFAALDGADGVGDLVIEADDDESNVGNSGLDEDEDGTEYSGIFVGLQRRTASKTECIDVPLDGEVPSPATADDDCKMDAITADDVSFATGATDAYYTLSATARDKAGNASDAISHTFVYDMTDPSATAPAVPGVIAAGAMFEGATYLNDNLSIRDYYGHVSYGTDFNLGIGLPVGVDDFDAASLTYQNHAVAATVGLITPHGALPPYKALQTSPGDDTPQALNAVSVFVRDQAGIYQAEETTGLTPTGVPTAGDDNTVGTDDDDLFGTTFALHWIGHGDDAGDDYDVCALPGGCGNEDGTDEDEEDFETSVKVEITALAAAAGTFRNPFERVDFWVTDVNGTSWFVGSDGSGTSGREDGDIDDNDANDRFRTWTYSVTLPGAMVAAATRAMTSVQDGTQVIPMIRAIVVNDENVGLVQASAVDISTEKP